MAKSAKKELQEKKKRAKRREALKAAPAHPWDGIDVSAWFDTRFLADEETGECCSSGLCENGLYERDNPAEKNLNYWAVTHPEEEKEAGAARLAASICLAAEKAEKSAGTEAKAHLAEKCRAGIQELKKLADKEGSVTANAVLGGWYNAGCNVRKNTAAAKKHLLKAAEAGDPYSCFTLAYEGYFPERTEEFYRRSRDGGCPSAFIMQADACLQGTRLPAAELELLALHLAAFAARNYFPCLAQLVQLIGDPCSECQSLRAMYAAPMLALLRKAAQSCAGAAELLARELNMGILCEKDTLKAKELCRAAMAKGLASASRLYAFILFSESRDLPQPERDAALQECYEVLRADCREGREPERANAMLGSYLVMSDDEEEFQEGVDCLKKCLACGDLDTPTDCAVVIVEGSSSQQRIAQGLKLLDAAYKKGDTWAKYLKGLYSLTGLYGKEEREQGAGLLLEAGKMGQAAAWGELAAAYTFGLYGFRVNLRKALSMAVEGDERGDENSHFLRLLLEVGEFSKNARPPAGTSRGTETAAMELGEYLEECDNGLIDAMDALLWLHATEVSGRMEPFYDLGRLPHPVGAFEHLAGAGLKLAAECVDALRDSMIPDAAFYLHVYTKISRTVYGRFFIGALAVRLGMAPDAPDAAVLKVLKDYLKGLPESYCKFRDWEGVPDLNDKMDGLVNYLLGIRSEICAQAGISPDDEDDDLDDDD